MENTDDIPKRFHECYRRWTGRTTIEYDIYARTKWERWVFEAKKRGWGGKDLQAVIQHVKDRAGSWKTPQLRLGNLLDVDTFQDNLAEVKVARDMKRNVRQAPTPKERVLNQSGRSTMAPAKSGIPIADVIAAMRKAID